MGSYLVRYGFGSDLEELDSAFLESNSDEEDSEKYYIRSHVCFSGYFDKRLKYEEAKDSYVYYSLSANPAWLRIAIKWINSLENSGIKVTLVKNQSEGVLVNCRYERQKDTYGFKNIYVNFTGNANATLISAKDAKEAGLKGFPIHRCAVKIEVSNYTSLKSKAMLEFIILVFLRLFDYKESYINRIFRDKSKTSLIEKALESSKASDDGHSLYNDWGGDFLTQDKLAGAFNIEIYNKYIEEHPKVAIGSYRQTGIINIGLGIDKVKYGGW